jgi:four helix bundle protein
VGARRYRDLAVWRIGHALRLEVYPLLDRPRVNDLRFRSQLSEAVASVTGNIAEGFGRRSHADFARFIDYARGSLNEITERLEDGLARGYWTPDDVSESFRLATRLDSALERFLRYLRNS